MKNYRGFYKRLICEFLNISSRSDDMALLGAIRASGTNIVADFRAETSQLKAFCEKHKLFKFIEHKSDARNKNSKKAKKRHKSSGKFYSSDAWLRLRYQVLKRDGAKCACCGLSREDGVKMHVDHIKPRSKYPSIELDINNLQVLCEDCNLGKSNTDETDWRSRMIAEITEYH